MAFEQSRGYVWQRKEDGGFRLPKSDTAVTTAASDTLQNHNLEQRQVDAVSEPATRHYEIHRPPILPSPPPKARYQFGSARGCEPDHPGAAADNEHPTFDVSSWSHDAYNVPRGMGHGGVVHSATNKYSTAARAAFSDLLFHAGADYGTLDALLVSYHRNARCVGIDN